MQGVALERRGRKGRFDPEPGFRRRRRRRRLAGRRAGGLRPDQGVDAKVARLDPEALGRAFAKIEQAAAPMLEEKKIEGLIGAELDKGALSLPARRARWR